MPRMLESSREYSLSRIFAVQYKPINKQSVPIKNRPRSSFLIPLKGKIYYHFENTFFEVDENELIYLPKSSNYHYQVDSGECEYMQVEFDLFETENGIKKDIVFSNTPCKKEVIKQIVHNHIKNIINGYNSEFYEYKSRALSSLYFLISIFLNPVEQNKSNHIANALKYITENKFEKIYIKELAEICHLSEAQFRRIFKKHMGCSPIQYKNRLVINAACEILKTESFTISETASALNFDDLYSFSKFFKRETGISPNEYKTKLVAKEYFSK